MIFTNRLVPFQLFLKIAAFIGCTFLIWFIQNVPFRKYFVTHHPESDPLDIALQILSQYPLVDSHNDWAEKIHSKTNGRLQDLDLLHLPTDYHTDITRLRRGKVSVQIWSAFVPCTTPFQRWNDALLNTLNQIDLIHRFVHDYSNAFELATSTSDIHNIRKKQKISSLIGLEGGHQISDSFQTLRMMYRLGVRSMTLTHTCHTLWADSCALPPIYHGLSEQGVQGILEMNRLGMLVDLSHVSHEAMQHAINVSLAPVIFTHSSAFTLCSNPRNVPDAILKILKEKDGVVMVNVYPQFVTCSSNATLMNVIDHIEHIAKIAGKDHVGIGADFDGIESVPIGMEDVSKYPFLVAELWKRNWTQDELVGFIGGNFMRVFKKVEEISKELTLKYPIEETMEYNKICP